jgi:hypothetical protein
VNVKSFHYEGAEDIEGKENKRQCGMSRGVQLEEWHDAGSAAVIRIVSTPVKLKAASTKEERNKRTKMSRSAFDPIVVGPVSGAMLLAKPMVSEFGPPSAMITIYTQTSLQWSEDFDDP